MLEAMMAFLVSAGPIGLFFASIIAHASLFLPLPVDMILIPLSAVDFFGLGIITPLLLGIIVAFGSSIGEMSGYFVGRAGIGSFEKMKAKEIGQLKILKEKLEQIGMPLIAFFAFVPLPFDLMGIVCGLSKYSKKKFFVAGFIGRVPRYAILAYAGYFGVSFILKFFVGG